MHDNVLNNSFCIPIYYSSGIKFFISIEFSNPLHTGCLFTGREKRRTKSSELCFLVIALVWDQNRLTLSLKNGTFQNFLCNLPLPSSKVPSQLALIFILWYLYLSVFHDKYQSYKYEKIQQGNLLVPSSKVLPQLAEEERQPIAETALPDCSPRLPCTLFSVHCTLYIVQCRRWGRGGVWRYTGIIHLVPGHMSPHAQVSSSHDIKDYIEAIWSGPDEGESGGEPRGNDDTVLSIISTRPPYL